MNTPPDFVLEIDIQYEDNEKNQNENAPVPEVIEEPPETADCAHMQKNSPKSLSDDLLQCYTGFNLFHGSLKNFRCNIYADFEFVDSTKVSKCCKITDMENYDPVNFLL